MSQISVKWNHNGLFRRFGLPVPANGDLYGAMMAKILAVVPDFNDNLAWKDSEGDMIVFTSTTELNEAVNTLKSEEPLRVFTVAAKNSERKKKKPSKVVEMNKEGDSDETEEKNQKEAEEKKETDTNQVHPNVVCDGCDGPVQGIRYKCLGCADYDLCSACEKKATHTQHPMARITDPTDRSWVPQHVMFMRRMWKRENQAQGHPAGPLPCRGSPYWINMVREARQQMQQTRQQMRERRRANGGAQGADAQPNSEQSINGEQQQQNTDPFVNGMDFLREVGTTVAEALSNLGINVDVDVEHEGKREKVASEPKTESESEAKSEDKTEEGKTEVKAEKAKDTEKKQEAEKTNSDQSGDETTGAGQEWTLVEGEGAQGGNNPALYPEIPPVVAAAAAHHGKKEKEEKIKRKKSKSPEKKPGKAKGLVVKTHKVEKPDKEAKKPLKVSKPDKDHMVVATMEHLKAMGFTNEEDWLLHLVEAKGGDINAVLNALQPGRH